MDAASVFTVLLAAHRHQGQMLDQMSDISHSETKPGSDLPIEEIINLALQTKPLTAEEKKALEEEYRKRERAKPGRKKGQES